MLDQGLGTISEEYPQQANLGGMKLLHERMAAANDSAPNFSSHRVTYADHSSSGIGIGFTPGNELDDFSFFAQQNGGKFDPVLFDDYREPQDSIASQDLGRYIDEWFPLPDLGSPGLTFDGAAINPPKPDLISEVDAAAQSGPDEVTVGEDGSQLMSCNKIW